MVQNILENTTLKANPFKVPDGYFGLLQGEIVAKAKASGEPKPIRKSFRLKFSRPVWAAAASVCVAVFGAYLYGRHISADTTEAQEATIEATHAMLSAQFDDASDYAMIDNEDIYMYLSNL